MINALRWKFSSKAGSAGIYKTVYHWINTAIKINYFLIFLFAYTAVSKLNIGANYTFIDVASFEEAMFKSPVLRPYVHELAYIIPLTEILACSLLLFTKTKKAGYYLSLFLLVSFTAYIVYILNVYKHQLPCVCGGVISLMSWTQHLLFNCFFIVITIRAVYLTHKRPE